MNLGKCIRKVREAKGFSQKQVISAINMGAAQYSRIESGKTDPSFSAVVKIAKGLGVELHELYKADELFKEVNTYDKTLMEKLSFIEQLDKKEKEGFYSILDALIAKKKLKDTLANALVNVG